MKNTKKQTALEWLESQIEEDSILWIYRKEFEQAKQMEKEQIIDSYNNGNESDHNNEFGDGGNKYYNETYNTETDGK